MGKTNRGFTLIEMVIVVMLIAIISTITIVINFQTQMKKSRDAKRKTDIERLRNALEMCRSDTGGYLATSGLVFGTTPTLACGGNTYLNPLPDDPRAPGAHYSYTSCGAAPCSTYTVSATLEMGGTYTGTPLGSQ